MLWFGINKAIQTSSVHTHLNIPTSEISNNTEDVIIPNADNFTLLFLLLNSLTNFFISFLSKSHSSETLKKLHRDCKLTSLGIPLPHSHLQIAERIRIFFLLIHFALDCVLSKFFQFFAEHRTHLHAFIINKKCIKVTLLLIFVYATFE